MKKLRIFLVALVCLLTLGLILFSCDDGTLPDNGNLPNNNATDDPLILTGTSGGKTITIKISQTDPSRAVLTPKGGEFYEIKVDGTLVSKGKLLVNGSAWTFTPSSDSPGAKTPFGATYSNNAISIPSIPGTNIANLTATKGTTTEPEDKRPTLTGTVTISSTSPKVGETLTATYSGGNGSGTATWQWLRGNEAISNSNSNAYVVAVADEGKTIRARVSYANQEGSITSEATAAVPTDNRPTLTGTVAISNTSPKIGDTLTAIYSPGNGSGTATWQWLRNDTLITGATSQSYTVVNADAGAKLKAQVRFADQKDSIISNATSAVPDDRPTLTGTVTISNTSPKVGDDLTATYSGGNGTGIAIWQWFRGDEEIPGTDNTTYKVTTVDAGKTLKAQVSYANQTGSITSGATAIVTASGGSTSTVYVDKEGGAQNTQFPDLTSALESITGTGNYTVRISGNQAISPINITGEGKSITLKAESSKVDVQGISDDYSGGNVFAVTDGAVLILESDITIKAGEGNLHVVSINGGSFKMKGGTLQGKEADSVVNVDYGTFTMEGGTICGNTSNYSGSGVYIGYLGIFIMNGGTITGNSTSNRLGPSGGGGVYLVNGGSFTMTGGTISGNSADEGGGVYFWGNTGTTFTMTGGTISGNSAKKGGGLYVSGSAKLFSFNGGTISGNTASEGGGVYIYFYGDDKTFSFNGGTISGNTADNGGGVYEFSGNFIMEKGTISGNMARDSGGGVYIESNGGFGKSGGTIYGYVGSDSVNSNVVKTSSGTILSSKGHAVYVNSDPIKRRESTAGQEVELYYYGNGTVDGAWDD